jgi:putative PIN family toxin of toxin-antitoxin system
MRVVLDTNVVVAGLRSRRGISRRRLDAILVGEHIAIVSVPLLTEYEAVALRPEHFGAIGLSGDELARFLDEFCDLSERVVLRYRMNPSLNDPADEMVLETAVEGGADAILTFNLVDFAPASKFKMPVLTPSLAWSTFLS